MAASPKEHSFPPRWSRVVHHIDPRDHALGTSTESLRFASWWFVPYVLLFQNHVFLVGCVDDQNLWIGCVLANSSQHLVGCLFVCLCSVVFVHRDKSWGQSQGPSGYLPAVEARVGKEKGVIAADDLTDSSPANHSPPMDNHEKKTAINLIRKIHHQKIEQILAEEESIIYVYITQPPNQLSCSHGSPRKKWCFFSLFNGGLMHYPIWRFQSQPAAGPSWYGDHHICPCNHRGYAVSFRWGLGGAGGPTVWEAILTLERW